MPQNPFADFPDQKNDFSDFPDQPTPTPPEEPSFFSRAKELGLGLLSFPAQVQRGDFPQRFAESVTNTLFGVTPENPVPTTPTVSSGLSAAGEMLGFNPNAIKEDYSNSRYGALAADIGGPLALNSLIGRAMRTGGVIAAGKAIAPKEVAPRMLDLPLNAPVELPKPTPKPRFRITPEGLKEVAPEESWLKQFPDQPEPGYTYNEDTGWEHPQFASTKSGGVKIGADVKSLGQVLGSSLYQGDFPKIATKELLQNSIDAIRPLGEKGRIDVSFNDQDHYVQVTDNGPGLTLKEIQTVFTDLGSSGKRSDQSAIGGFGLAKAAPLLGGKKVEVTSNVRQGNKVIQYKFNGTPEELLNGVDITSTVMPSETETGTTVRTYFPDDSNTYYARDFIDKLAENSFGYEGQINKKSVVQSVYSDKEMPFDERTYIPNKNIKEGNITSLSNEASDIDIIIPKDAKYKPSRGVHYTIANNGMYQTNARLGYNELPGIPDKIIVNIRSKVPEGHPNYPFTANRESLRGPALEQVEKHLQDVVVNPAIGSRMAQLRRVYESMPEMNIPSKGSRKFYIYDVGKKFLPEELQAITEDPQMQTLSTHISDTITDVLGLVDRPDWSEKLEKVGLIFDDKLFGIHIPNPGEKKSAILINPLQSMVGNSPDQAAASIHHTILHELAHIPGGGHDEGFTIRLGDIYSKVGAKRALLDQEKLLDAISTNGQYIPEIQNILSKYVEARGRETTVEDPLYGTGIGARDKRPQGEGKVSPNRKQSTRRATAKLLNALVDATGLREEQEVIYSQERGKRAAAFSSVKERGEKGAFKALGKLKGEYPKVEQPELSLNQADTDTLFTAIRDSDLRPFEQARSIVALAKILSGESVPQRNELLLLDRVFGKGFGGHVQKLYGGLGLVEGGLKPLTELANITRAMKTSFDLSAPLRQGITLIHRPEYWNAFAEMNKGLGRETWFKDILDSIYEKELFKPDESGKSYADITGLKITNITDYTHLEEQYMSKLAEKIPGIAHSERAYLGFLNKLRADTFESLINDAQKQGLDPLNNIALGKEIADFVNNATGRGSLGNFERYAVPLNNLLFSPRFIASRIKFLNPNTYVKASPFVRQQYLKSLGAMVGTGLTTLTLMKLAGATVNTNPSNSDFMKAKIGNTRIDPWGGFQQYITTFSNVINEIKSNYVEGKSPRYGSTPALARFGYYKLSPAASTSVRLIFGRDPVTGQRLNIPDEMQRNFEPMFIEDVIKLIKEDPNAIPTIPLELYGMGVQTYEPRNTVDLRLQLSR